MVQITAEQKSPPAEVSDQTPVPQNVTPYGPKESGVKSTNAKKDSKEKLAPLTAEQTTTPAEPYEEISVPHKVTPDGLKNSGVKSTKSLKKPRGKKGAGIQTPDDSNKKTPYQGSRRACGLFHCLNCKKGWFSPHTWKDTYQRCKGCNAEIYPHIQFKPQKGNGLMKTTPPHPKHLCQMCMKLGYLCVNFTQVTTKKVANHQREE